jgi:transcription antitermination factor NusG
LEKHVGDCFHGTDLVVGDAVIVREGPLKGLRGVIDRMDRKKLYINVDAIPGSVTIEIEPHQVQLEKDSAYSLVTSR